MIASMIPLITDYTKTAFYFFIFSSMICVLCVSYGSILIDKEIKEFNKENPKL